MRITSDIHYVGVNDYNIDLFEGMYKVPNGIAYNSYIILDEKTAILDTVDAAFTNEWMEKVKKVLDGRKPDYLIVQHMEPDHSANILKLLMQYPDITLVASEKAFTMMKNYFGRDFSENRLVVSDGDELNLGKHTLHFITALMVHWPEVIMTYDSTDKVLFTADAFGKFGAVDASEGTGRVGKSGATDDAEGITEQIEKADALTEWLDEARRYYFGIVGKYGVSVQKVLGKIADWDIERICPLHGPVLSDDIGYYVKTYDTWSNYKPEEEGILIAYASVYGNTEKAMFYLEKKLREKGYMKVYLRDLSRTPMSKNVADAFRYSKLVLASTTYNGELFPTMREFLHRLRERNFCRRTVAFVENGSWAPNAAKFMKEILARSAELTYLESEVRIFSVLNEESAKEIDRLAEELCKVE